MLADLFVNQCCSNFAFWEFNHRTRDKGKSPINLHSHTCAERCYVCFLVDSNVFSNRFDSCLCPEVDRGSLDFDPKRNEGWEIRSHSRIPSFDYHHPFGVLIGSFIEYSEQVFFFLKLKLEHSLSQVRAHRAGFGGPSFCKER